MMPSTRNINKQIATGNISRFETMIKFFCGKLRLKIIESTKRSFVYETEISSYPRYLSQSLTPFLVDVSRSGQIILDPKSNVLLGRHRRNF